MKKTLILLFSLFQFASSYSQLYYSPVDSIIGSLSLTDSDWVIGLTIDQAGRIGMYDSLGNMLDEDPNGTYIISKIDSRCSLQKLNPYFIGSESGNRYIPKVIDIFDGVICSYTSDSIKKVENEWIYPNIYVNDSLKVYNIQLNGDHSPSFRFCFRTRQSTEFRSFSEVDVYTSPILINFFQKNLNYVYNSSTFIYRAFMNIINLLRKNFKILILQ